MHGGKIFTFPMYYNKPIDKIQMGLNTLTYNYYERINYLY